MKKRLLSAFLALAMVLTLLPATAFATTYTIGDANPDDVSYDVVSGGNTVTHRFYEVTNAATNAVSTVNVTYQAADDNTTGKHAGKWYWQDNKNAASGTQIYYAVTDGIVVGTGTSGQWYPSLNDYVTLGTNANGPTKVLKGTSFTLLQDDALPSGLTTDPTTLTVDVNGFQLSLPATLPNSLGTLTITDKLHPLSTTGSVTAIAKDIDERTTGDRITYTPLTLTATNVTIPSIDLQGGANRVTLNNVSVTSTITMDGETITHTAGRPDSTVYNGQQLSINVADKTNLSTSTSVGGAITVTGDSSTLNLNNVTGGQTLTVTGNGGTVTVDGATLLGAVTVGSREGNNAAIPSVTVNGGTVGAITRDNTNATTQTNQVTINQGATAYAVVSAKGQVKVDRGSVTDAIVVDEGSVTLSGPVTIGMSAPNAIALKLGAIGKTTLSISGNGSKIGGVKAVVGSNLTISQWPAGRENYFGVLDLGNYGGRGVTGGVFNGTQNNPSPLNDGTKATWFSTDLQLVANATNIAAGGMAAGVSKLSLYGKNEMARAISDLTSANGNITTPTVPAASLGILCQLPTYTLSLKNGNIEWAQIKYGQPTGMILPAEINGFSIAKWISSENDASVPSGTEQTIPVPAKGGSITLSANDVNPSVAKSITRAAPSKDNTVENQHVRVTMNGNNIQLSGAIAPAPGSNIATILLDLTTDALKQGPTDAPADGTYVVIKNVQVNYNVDTKTVSFNRIQAIDGAIINDAGELVLNNGTGAHYTVSASLTQSASTLGLYVQGNTEIQATIGGNLSRRTQSDKDRIIEQIAGTGASFEINGNRAVLEAINAVQATYTNNSSVDNWVTTARNYVWRNGNKYLNTKGQPNGLGKGDPNDVINPHTGNFSTTGNFGADGQKIADKYAKAYIVPYLVVNATDLNDNGTLTASLTVYYRVDVSTDGTYDPNEYYTVQTGRALGTLSGDMAQPVLVKFSANASPFSGTTYMHQDGKYVYAKDGTTGKWSIDHAGTGSGSLGTIVLNMTDGPITLTRANGTVEPTKYDTLQAAIDDTRPGWTNSGDTGTPPTNPAVPHEYMDTVSIGGTYAETNCTVTMTGAARKILVKSIGNRKITTNTKDVDVQTAGGYNYTIELKKDAVVSGTVAIAVTSTGNGTLSANRSTAKPGETVTVTTVPTAGQAVSSISAKTNSGANVSVTSTGVANQYRFTVPQNATSVTVTASFGKATAANLTITSSNYGLAATSSTQVYAGQEVTITTTPYTGYRTTGVTVSTNAGTLTATRTADNVYKFTVPANATYVTVTPTFAADTGLPFVDVPANDFYLDAVKFVYEKGLMNGITATTFGGSRTITRGQIVTILYRLSGNPAVSNTSSFQDVPANEYYAPAITWAASNGIVNGRNSTSFAPNDAITRQELAAILYRYTSFRGLTNNKLANLSGYTDQGQVDGYAVTPMQWCVGNGIINGTSNTTLTPRGTAQRYQAAIMLMRYCQAFLNM